MLCTYIYTFTYISLFDVVSWLFLAYHHKVGSVPLGDAWSAKDHIFTGYSDGVDQDDFLHHGNSFLKEFYPRLDYIKTCSLLDDPISSM